MMEKKEDIAFIHAEKNGNSDIIDQLINIPINSLNPILVKVFREKSKKITPQMLLNAYENNLDFVGPSSFSQKELLRFRNMFFKILPSKFQTIQLSPITPFGTCVATTKLSQDMRLTTIKNSELVSDSTTVLSLEASRLRKKCMKNEDSIYDEINLATFHRILRLQNFDKSKGYMQHFEILGTLTAGRAKGKNNYILEKIFEHIEMWICFINNLNNNSYFFKDIVVSFSHIKLIESILNFYKISREEINDKSLVEDYNFFDKYNVDIPKKISSITEIKKVFESDTKIFSKILDFEDSILTILRNKYPKIKFNYELDRKLGLGYFSGFCFHVYAKNNEGNTIQLIDGGEIDWTKQLLSDNHELAVSSSFGAELIQKKFKL